ncbi:MAG TPA: hotdog domain-containing protein [Acidimicrobiales bacterium]|nr:hotdog domain-containing protein [Acidimicrobiales bacterium]
MLGTAKLVAFVPVTGVARAQEFYVGTLGLTLVSADHYGCMRNANGNTRRMARVDGYSFPGHTAVGWEVPSIERSVRALVAAGVEVQRHDGMGQDELGIWTAPSGDRVAWITDTEGNTLSVTQSARGALSPLRGRSGMSTGGGRTVLFAPVGTQRPELTPSFERHPALRGRQAEAHDLAQVLRRLIRLSVSTAPSAAETAALTARLNEVADELETHLPEVPLPRFMAPDESPGADSEPRDRPLGGLMPFDLVVGGFNPLALPVTLAFAPPKAFGYATFDVGYEGAPGCVHGAALAATFDIILTAANAIAEATGPTVRLSFRFRRPTLIGEEAVFEAWVTEVTDRRIFSRGQVVQGGVVTVEAEGEFAILNGAGVNRMASGRRRSFDAAAGGGGE